MRRELEDGAPGGQLFAQCAVQFITFHLLRLYTSLGDLTAAPSLPLAPSSPRTLTAGQLHQVIACIRDQPGHDLTVDTLAQQTGLSRYHFARMFRRTTGETPHQFVLRERLTHAPRLLEATELPVAQVAVESGFADQSAFTRAFKRFQGITPRSYLRERAN